MREGKVIRVEGIIGAGKTTFSEKLANSLDGIWLREPDEKDGNPYLERFYNDPNRWALTMQLHLLNTRYRMHQRAQWNVLQNGSNVILDRSYYGDTAFARLQLKNKTIDRDEYNTYSLAYKNMTSNVMFPNFCIHLQIDPEVSSYRIQKRMQSQTGRQCENVIDLKYLKNLQEEEAIVIDVLKQQGVQIISVDWNKDMTDDDINLYCQNIANQIKTTDIRDLFIN